MNTHTTTATTPALDSTIDTTTTDLALVEKKALDALQRTLAKDDLDAFLMGGRRSLMLADTSSSMSTPTRQNVRRVDVLRNVVATLRETHPCPVAAFGAFYTPDGFQVVQVVNDIPEPRGGTPLAEAIDFGQAQGATHLIVVTDGEPDDDEAAFAAAARFGQPIDVVFCGDPGTQGARFAQELAKRTGGTCDINDLSEPKKLAGQIRLLLGDGN